jgi:hypothetical protein
MNIPSQKSLFTIPGNVTYLNCAYMSPLLNGAASAGADAIHHRNEPWTFKAKDWFEPAEEEAVSFYALEKNLTQSRNDRNGTAMIG